MKKNKKLDEYTLKYDPRGKLFWCVANIQRMENDLFSIKDDKFEQELKFYYDELNEICKQEKLQVEPIYNMIKEQVLDRGWCEIPQIPCFRI